MKFSKKDINKFLEESNAIEGVYGPGPLAAAKKAWWKMFCKNFATRKKRQEINTSVIKNIHYHLIHKINPIIAGCYRTYDVRVGWRIIPFISHDLFETDLRNICLYINESIKNKDKLYNYEKEEICKKAHIMFEAWHGFGDGNGRIGRIIMNWHRWKLGLPIMIIHADINIGGEEQKNYYEWFK